MGLYPIHWFGCRPLATTRTGLFMRAVRGVVLVLVGVTTAAALAVGVAAPASAVDIEGIRAYQQTLPASVIDQPGLTDDEKVAWTNGTRSGVIDKPVVPVAPYTYTKPGGGVGPAIFKGGGALGMLFMLDGAMQAQQGLGEFWWKEVEKPAGVDQAEWDACRYGGDASNIWDGFNDWMSSIQNIMGTGEGSPINCEEARKGWQLDRNPDYVPIGTVGDTGGSVTVGTSFGTTLYSATILPAVWDDRLTPTAADNPLRKIGWIYPVQNGTNTTNTTIHVQYVRPDGTIYWESDSSWNPNNGTGAMSAVGAPAVCSTVTHCYDFRAYSSVTTAEIDANHLMLRISTARMAGGTSNLGTKTLPVLPYVDPLGGTFTPGLARQVLLTSVKTEAGNVYQCRTVSFVETAPTIPRPCEPEVPDWEVITERNTEIVPETDTGYVPGSNPTRGISTTTVPDVVRDWDRDHDADTLYLLDLELEGVGSCFDNPDACADWYTDPNKAQKYTCSDGAVTYALEECRKYARIFKPGAITSGTAYPAPGPNPTAPPGTQTSTSPGPSVAPGTDPADPTKSRECFPTGWGVFNPFEWVFKPVKCAMEWAFVPRKDWVNARFNTLKTKWDAKGPIVLATAISQWHIAPQLDGCDGINVPLSQVWSQVEDFHILQACPGDPLAPIASLSSVVLGIAGTLGALFAASRNLAGIVSYRGLSE